MENVAAAFRPAGAHLKAASTPNTSSTHFEDTTLDVSQRAAKHRAFSLWIARFKRVRNAWLKELFTFPDS